jgi:hypothetical protein
MGLPGIININITTSFDEGSNSVSRRIYYLGGWGLNCLAASHLGDPEFWWDINRSIMEDTIDLRDGTYTLENKYVGPGPFDYKWSPTENINGDI